MRAPAAQIQGEKKRSPMSATQESPTKPLHDPIAPPERDPPNKPMHDPPGDPTFEPPQPLTEPTPNPASDPPPEMPGDPSQMQGYHRVGGVCRELISDTEETIDDERQKVRTSQEKTYARPRDAA